MDKMKRRIRLSLMMKIVPIAILSSLIFSAGLYIYFFPRVKTKLIETDMARVKTNVETVYSMLNTIYQSNQGKSEEEIKAIVLNSIKNLRYGKNKEGYFWINNLQPRMIMHPIKPSLDGKDLSDFKDANGQRLFVKMVETCKEKGEGYVRYMWPKPGSDKPALKVSYVKLFKPWGWILGSGIYLNNAEAKIRKLRWNTLILIFIATFLSVVLGVFVARKISKNAKSIAEVADAIAKGDFSKEIAVKSKDEIGEMANALKEMLNGVIGEGVSIKQRIPIPFWTANKDLVLTHVNDTSKDLGASEGMTVEEAFGKETREMAEESLKTGNPASRELVIGNAVILGTANVLRDLRGEIMGVMGIGVNITEQKEAQKKIEENQRLLFEVAREVQEVANQVAAAAEILSSQSDEIAAGAEEQSAQANQVAAAVEEMNATIAEVAKSAQEAADRSQEARDVATQGSQVVEDAMGKIKRLSETTQKVSQSIESLAEKSRQIDKVIDVISSIADQTNLLALNATIEAASAGEAGKGFAVVAGEIKELAKQTAASTESVGEAIEHIQEGIKVTVDVIQKTTQETLEAAKLAEEAGVSLNEIVTKAGNAAEMVTGIAAAAQQQSAAVGEISKNVDGIMTVSQQTAQGINESARAAKELAQLSEKLLETAKRFQE